MRRPQIHAFLAIALAAAALSACGGDDGGSSGGSGGGGGKAEPAELDGKQLFAGTCGSCHVLSAAGTEGTFGPSLDEVKPSQSEVAAAIKDGPGQMPAGLLEGAEADAVSAYVAENAGS